MQVTYKFIIDLRALLKQRGVTQTAIAIEMGGTTTSKAVSWWCRGGGITLHGLCRLAEVLGMKPEGIALPVECKVDPKKIRRKRKDAPKPCGVKRVLEILNSSGRDYLSYDNNQYSKNVKD